MSAGFVGPLAQRVPRLLWQIVLHAAYLAVFTAIAAASAPILLLLRCVHACWVAATTSRSAAKQAVQWQKHAVVVVGADTDAGAALVQYFCRAGAGLAVACGTDTNTLHEVSDALPAAKILRCSGYLQPAADAQRVLELLSAANKTLAVVVLATAEGWTTRLRDGEEATQLGKHTDYAAKIVAALRPALQQSAKRYATQGGPCSPRVVVTAPVDDPLAAASARVFLSATEYLLSHPADPAERVLATLLRYDQATVAEAAVIEEPRSPVRAGHDNGPATAGSSGRAAYSPRRGGTSSATSAFARSLGEAAVDLAAFRETTVASTPVARVLLALRARQWIELGVPTAFGLRAQVLSLLGMS
jgi:hypothetical protein